MRNRCRVTSGAAEVWQKMLKLRTTVSVMHITAHPDDEHGGVLTKLSRGDGARVTLLTLNRGESGDNAIGPQLFDALGLIRTEELLVSNRYYGVDQQYFTTVVDYGFSKLLEEALGKWGRETVLRDVVRIVRMERPTIILSRFQGSDRDGHGNHQAAGLMAQEAFLAAGDPTRYPEQIRDGLRPWSPAKVYVGGVRADEDWTVRVDSGEYDAVLGDSYDNFARRGLSFQRSQNSGRFTPTTGPNYGYYKLAAASSGSAVKAGRGAKEQSLLDSLPRNIEGAIGAVRQTARRGGGEGLRGVSCQRSIRQRACPGAGPQTDARRDGRGRRSTGAAPAPDQGTAVPGRDQRGDGHGADRGGAAGRHPRTNRPRGGVRAAGADGGARAGTDVRSAGAAGESRRRDRNERGDHD